MATTIVMIEDDVHVAVLVGRYLERDGFTPVTAGTGRAGLHAVEAHRPALVLLDVNLPDLDGWSVLRRLREGVPQPAVIMLTARSDEPDRLLGLDLGADDYIVKPFSPREVVARVRAVLRRSGSATTATDALCFSGLHIDLAGRRVLREEQLIDLTPKEFDLLAALAGHAGRVLTRLSLYDTVWGDDGQGDIHTLDVHINRLRRKLSGDDGRTYIYTVKGIGFKFEGAHDE